ncbi:MAG: HEAT repeat domain-containing protein [Planctomycetota bacterium]|jgi:hypothetical protein
MKNKVFNRILGVAVVAVVVWLAWNYFRVGDRVTKWQALEDICSGRAVAQGRQNLLDLNDRAGVLQALREKLAESGDTIRCKKNHLQTLSLRYFNQPRTINRALSSEQEATRRAAASLRYGDPELKDRCGEIALAWIKDPEADSRHDAVLICRYLRLEEAVPTLLEVLDMVPETADEVQLVEHSLAALKDFKATGLSDKLVAIIANESLNDRMRGAALETLGRVDDAPREKVQGIAIRLLSNRAENTFMRGKAVSVLRGKPYANEATWTALEATILDEKETNGVIQRMCLNALGSTADMDRLEKLLLNRRVYTNPYFGFRIDVAAALSALNLRERVAFDILCEYLVDDDPKDTAFKVRQEAWLSLWTLAGDTYGRFYGLPQPEIFQRAPKAPRDREMARRYLWQTETTRPGVNMEQIAVLRQLTPDLKPMKRIREEFEKRRPEIFLRWERERKEEEEPQEPPTKEKETIVPPGPLPPKEQPKKQAEKEDKGKKEKPK